MDFNLKRVIRTLSLFLLGESILIFVAALVAVWYTEPDAKALFLSAGITLAISSIALLPTWKLKGRLSFREAHSTFALLWIVLASFGMLPFLLSGGIPNVLDAFFEALSGITTTGSSILVDVDELSHGLLFWRSCLQWFGGLCFIALLLFITYTLGLGGASTRIENKHIFLNSNRFHSRISQSIILIAGIYLVITLVEWIALAVAGMSIFDALCHSFTTISAGGFSTHTDNIAHWQSYSVRAVLTFFMFIAGTNLVAVYYLATRKFRKIMQNEELRYYIIFILLFSIIISLELIFGLHEQPSFAISEALFQVTSIVSTTGFYVSDFVQRWPIQLSIFIFLLMIVGATYGSAGGGIKILRLVLLIKNAFHEIQHFMHSRSVSAVRFNRQLIPLTVVNNAFLFLLLYIFVCVVGVLALSAFNIDLGPSLRLVLTSTSNIGCGTGTFLASGSLASLPAGAKITLMLLMLIGRLEMYSFFILFTRSFWHG